jgi:hypothetical protein
VVHCRLTKERKDGVNGKVKIVDCEFFKLPKVMKMGVIVRCVEDKTRFVGEAVYWDNFDSNPCDASADHRVHIILVR